MCTNLLAYQCRIMQIEPENTQCSFIYQIRNNPCDVHDALEMIERRREQEHIEGNGESSGLVLQTSSDKRALPRLFVIIQRIKADINMAIDVLATQQRIGVIRPVAANTTTHIENELLLPAG